MNKYFPPFVSTNLENKGALINWWSNKGKNVKRDMIKQTKIKKEISTSIEYMLEKEKKICQKNSENIYGDVIVNQYSTIFKRI